MPMAVCVCGGVVLLVQWVRNQGHSFMLSLAAAMPLCGDLWNLHLATENNLRVSQYEMKLEFINDNGSVGISKGFSVLMSPVKESSVRGLQGRKDPKHPK